MTIIEQYWATASAGDWVGFGALLADDVVYELPQTRERIRGRERYVRFNAEYPAGWRLTIEQSHVDATGGASWATFTMDGETMPAVTFFRFDPAGADHPCHRLLARAVRPPGRPGAPGRALLKDIHMKITGSSTVLGHVES